jgi:ectoine hydroxylase-related dioxygenase (phytanoyl-CoA dioxygenase family)
MQSIVSASQRGKLERDGFFVLSEVFSRAEMVELETVIDAYHRRTLEWVREHGEESGISRPDEITFTCHIAEQDPRVRAFCLRPELVSLSTSILGDDVDLYWNQSVFKEPEAKREFPWHQDDGYCPVAPSPYLTVWLALTDATPDNGCISVLPGRHKLGLLPHKESPLGQVCHDADDPDQGVHVPVSSGSMAVMYSLLPHKSGPNLSKKRRNAFVIQYCAAKTRHAVAGKVLGDRIPVARRGQPIQAPA